MITCDRCGCHDWISAIATHVALIRECKEVFAFDLCHECADALGNQMKVDRERTIAERQLREFRSVQEQLNNPSSPVAIDRRDAVKIADLVAKKTIDAAPASLEELPMDDIEKLLQAEQGREDEFQANREYLEQALIKHDTGGFDGFEHEQLMYSIRLTLEGDHNVDRQVFLLRLKREMSRRKELVAS